MIPLSRTCDRHAADLAERYGLPLGDTTADVHLLVSPEGLALRASHGELAAGKPVAINWQKRDATSPMGARLTQPLFKAVGIHKGDAYRPTVIDATAGFGDDSYLLAAVGCRVTAVERNPALAAMLEDAVNRVSGIGIRVSDESRDALRDPTPDTRYPIQVLHADAVTALPDLRGDVVYLDPMFPPGRKTVEKKPMRLLRELVGESVDEGALFAAALRAATKRVVVKRPLRAEPLTGLAPKVTHKGQAVRYDVYIPAELS